jgi:chromosome segregation ATPase
VYPVSVRYGLSAAVAKKLHSTLFPHGVAIMATRAELEAILVAARTERDRGDAADSQAESEREQARAEWERTRTDYYKARDDWEITRNKLDVASPEYEKARERWISDRTDWQRVDAEYSRLRTEDARALEERLRGRAEREAAYNAAADALEQLLATETGRRRGLEDAFARAESEREIASVTWEKAIAAFNSARLEYEQSIAEWEQVRARWQSSRDALDEFNRTGQ